MGPGYVRFLFIQTIKGKKTTDPPLSQFPGHIREVAPSRSHAPWHETLRMESVLGELKEVWAYHEVHEAWFLALLTSTSPFHSPERGLTLGSRNHVLCTDCVLSKSIRGNPNPQEMVLVHETFGRWLGHDGICVFITEVGEISHHVHFSSVAHLCLTFCDPMNYSTSGLPVHHQLPEFTQTHVHWVGMPCSHLILCQPLLLLPLIPPSIGLFQWVNSAWGGQSIGVSALASVLPMNTQDWTPRTEHPGLIPFRMDWLDLLAVQGILKSLLQHHSSKASILQRSAFFTVQLSHPYLTTGKTIALTRRTFVAK